jgi:peptide chain release factor 3
LPPRRRQPRISGQGRSGEQCDERARRHRRGIELARGGYPEFDLEAYRHGDLTPVYFGSALKNFGVAELIDAIAKYAPPPRPQPSDQGTILPDQGSHRLHLQGAGQYGPAAPRPDRLHAAGFGHVQARHEADALRAWASRSRSIRRSCSLRRTARLPTPPSRAISSASPTTAPCAWAIRCPNSTKVRFTGLPNFAPEILRRVVLKDPTKTKQLRKALDDLSEEGVIQVFYPEIGGQWIVGVVGQLQLEVLISRLEAEYKVEAVLEMAPFETARWLKGPEAALAQFADFNKSNLAKDRDGDPVFMARSSWDVNYQQERNPELVFSATKER